MGAWIQTPQLLLLLLQPWGCDALRTFCRNGGREIWARGTALFECSRTRAARGSCQERPGSHARAWTEGRSRHETTKRLVATLPCVHSLWSAVGTFVGLPETAWHPEGNPALPGSFGGGLGSLCFPFPQGNIKGVEDLERRLLRPTCAPLPPHLHRRK